MQSWSNVVKITRPIVFTGYGNFYYLCMFVFPLKTSQTYPSYTGTIHFHNLTKRVTGRTSVFLANRNHMLLDCWLHS